MRLHPHIILCLLAFFLLLAPPALAQQPASPQKLPQPQAQALPIQSPIHMLVRTIWPIKPSTVVDFYLYLWTDKGPVTFDQMKPMQGAKLHVILVSPDYKNFYHAYPIATGGEGEFRFSIDAVNKEPLRAFALFTTTAGRQVVSSDVNGETPTPIALEPPQIIQSETETMMFTVHFPSQLMEGKTSEGLLYATLKNAKKPLVELEPVKDDYAYFTAFSSDFRTLSEIVPIDPPATADKYGGPAIRFRLTPAKAGIMRIIVQMRARGEDLLVPFTLRIAPAIRYRPPAPEEDPSQTPQLPPDSKLGE